MKTIVIAITAITCLNCSTSRSTKINNASNNIYENAKISTWEWSETPIRYKFSCNFPDYFYKDEVRSAFKYWDDLVDYQLFVEVKGCFNSVTDWEDENMIIVYSYFKPNPENRKNSYGTCWRHREDGYIISSKIMLWRSYFLEDDDTKKTIIRHEVGHALGLHHVKQQSCIMYKYSSDPKQICRNEKKEFLKHYVKEKTKVKLKEAN